MWHAVMVEQEVVPAAARFRLRGSRPLVRPNAMPDGPYRGPAADAGAP